MAQRQETILPRTLGDLLSETFSIYGKHFWRFIGLVALVQLPLSLLGLIRGGGLATFIVIAVIALLASIIVFGAIMVAVGQQYVSGEIKIRLSYRRGWNRILTLALLTVILLLVLVPALVVVSGVFWQISPPIAFVITLLASVPFIAHWVLAVESVIFEGHKLGGALGRTFNLVREDLWRVYGVFLAIMLVSIGLAILITIPFAFASWVAAPEQATALSGAIQFLGSVVVTIAVPPVAFIGGTLLYYDLRVRKENYDFSILSQEMGIAPA
ncbi:MAG: hypothetical protein IIC84_02465 [Chloroflexi bacterium]|nr:hypothetical protein [Chloroflexota bacterium]